jgi:hypothetical protein
MLTIQVEGHDGKKYVIPVVTIPNIADATFDENVLSQFEELFDIKNIPRKSGPIDLLLGVDQSRFHGGQSVFKGNSGLRQGLLGPVVFGSRDSVLGGDCLLTTTEPSPDQVVDLTKFWETEQLGLAMNDCNCMKTSSGKKLSLVEKEEYEVIVRSAIKVQNQWKIPYPWARDPKQLPDNYTQAYAKLCSTENRLSRIPEAAKQYDAQIKDLVLRGCARRLTTDEIKNYRGPIHYNR